MRISFAFILFVRADWMLLKLSRPPRLSCCLVERKASGECTARFTHCAYAQVAQQQFATASSCISPSLSPSSHACEYLAATTTIESRFHNRILFGFFVVFARVATWIIHESNEHKGKIIYAALDSTKVGNVEKWKVLSQPTRQQLSQGSLLFVCFPLFALFSFLILPFITAAKCVNFCCDKIINMNSSSSSSSIWQTGASSFVQRKFSKFCVLFTNFVKLFSTNIYT